MRLPQYCGGHERLLGRRPAPRAASGHDRAAPAPDHRLPGSPCPRPVNPAFASSPQSREPSSVSPFLARSSLRVDATADLLDATEYPPPKHQRLAPRSAPTPCRPGECLPPSSPPEGRRGTFCYLAVAPGAVNVGVTVVQLTAVLARASTRIWFESFGRCGVHPHCRTSIVASSTSVMLG